MNNPKAQKEQIDLWSMTDAEIETFDASKLEESGTATQEKEPPSGTSTEGAELDEGGTGGADTPETPATPEESTDSTSAKEVIDPDTGVPAAESQRAGSGPYQESDKPAAASEQPAQPTAAIDYKAEYDRVMAPFKAAKRDIKLDNIDDARRLMQMGVDYSRKMEAMKPYQRVLKTLERNNLLDIGKLNFLIDLDKKNPEAIKKFLSDSKIDPMELSLDGGTPYKLTDHSVNDQEMALDIVLDDIRQTETFDRMARVITKDWDTASRKILYETPGIIKTLNDHMQAGIFDKIIEVVEREKILGRLVGMSDLEAYKTVGDAMYAQNGARPNSGGAPSSNGVTAQQSQNSGSPSAQADDLRNRRLAASLPKGAGSAGKPKVNLADLTDEQVEKLDFRSL